MSLASNIVEMATTSVTDFLEGSMSEGVLPAVFKNVQKHFQERDTLRSYYHRAVKRSILSLEIALKGPRAYYPSREKEFYRQHFVPFEQKVFAPFSQGAIAKGWVSSEEELRDACVADCDKVKKTATAIFGLEKLNEKQVQEILSSYQEEDEQISLDVVVQLQKRAQCQFLPQLLQAQNVLLMGIFYHFHSFLQANPKFGPYVNYLETKKVQESIRTLHKKLQENPQEKQLAQRLARMEKFAKGLQAYSQKMGAIGKKLDNIYEKTVQTYEVLQRLERQMQSRFNLVEERLGAIYELLSQTGGSGGHSCPGVMEKPEEREIAETPAKSQLQPPPESGPEPESEPEEVDVPIEESPQEQEEIVSPQERPSLLPKHRRNIFPNNHLFAGKTHSSSSSSVPKKPSQPAAKRVSPSSQLPAFFQESQQEAASEASLAGDFDQVLDLYSTFLASPQQESFEQEQESLAEESAWGIPFLEGRIEETQPVEPVEKPVSSSQQESSRRSKRAKGDDISSIFRS